MRNSVLVLALLASAGLGDTLVDSTGKVRHGAASVDRTAKVATIGKKRLKLSEVFLIEKDDGRLLYAPDFAVRMRGYEYLTREHLRGAYLGMLRKAIQVQDYALARAAIERVEHAGLAGKVLSRYKRRLEKVAAKRRGIPSKHLRTKMRGIAGYFGNMLAERAQRALDGGTDGARLLREALRRTPASALGKELLLKIAPKSFPIGNARTWLDWHVDLVGAGASIATGTEAALVRGKKQWRKDLHGVGADPILLITPVTDSRLIGRCLGYGRLACEALSEMFQTDTPARTPDAPMTVFLFGSRKEYMTNTGTGKRREDPASLEWTAGHYSPSEGISRFYWLKDPDAERRIIGTCVHELTHHWLEERNPRIPRRFRAGDSPAYWIVEGFATFMEEGIFDLDTKSWTLFNPRARSLDMLQALDRRHLVPWNIFFRMHHIDFFRLPRDNRVEAQGRWWLRPAIMSTGRIFYEQAGAACQFLYHAENGKYRRKLLDFIVAYYSNNRKALEPTRAFGMSGAQLGVRIEAFARKVSHGWKPADK